ncbi:DUF433 domain-containing protein [Thermoanaerobacterium sp. DL9XJH110]|uniref:DUF433 domain-containing protein n=1 Tax=Thermoanaerobacterium sp. DL9XJH110 TaxID=3386643 RepID=UPI003BB6314A
MEDRIIIDPEVMCGKPVIKGTRIPVYLILDLLAAGYTTEKIIESYPQLKKADIVCALKYAAKFMKYEEDVFTFKAVQ